MRIPGVQRARRILRRVRQRMAPSAVILLYHRVVQLRADPQLLSVSPQNFRAQLEVLHRIARPISLQQLAHFAQAGGMPRRAVAITFDDGFRDNLEQAKPILEEHQIPATVFVSSGYVGTQREFWWDELERIFLLAGELPPRLEIKLDGRSVSFDLGNDCRYSEADAARHAGWDIAHPVHPTARHRTYVALCRLLRETTVAVREQALRDLRQWAGDDGVGRLSHCALSPDGVRQLGKGGLCEIGAHTVNHPRLSSLPVAEQVAEVHDSRIHLEQIMGSSVTSFSYPFGGQSDYTAQTVEAARRAGFVCACSNFEQRVWKRTDGFQLPRFVVRNWSGDEFERNLQRWRLA